MLEKTILSNLILNEEFSRKVYPYLKEDYFDDNSLRKIFNTCAEYVDQYKEPPSKEALKLAIEKRKDLTEDGYSDIHQIVDELKIDPTTNSDFLLDETEKFCQNKDLYNAIRKSIMILDDADGDNDKGTIPKLLADSLGISFDSSVGHDFLTDFEDRYEHYHKKEERIPFDIDILNKITKGGLPRKSMTVLLATTGGGKSLLKCHMAANHLMYGKNVLYITMEMAEEEIGRRIDANIMDITLDEVQDIPRDVYEKRMNRYKSKTTGKLIVKEYPTGSAHANHFRALLNELKLKKNFRPDMIYIDYLNICASARMKGMGGAINSYSYIKSIAEELRGLAVEFDVPVMSATQTTRSGFSNDDVGLEDTSESFGLPATADFMFALITNDELKANNQILVKQLKNRYNDLGLHQRFVIGVDRSKMRLYDVDQNDSPLNKEVDHGPAFDNSAAGKRISQEKFTGFKL